MKNRVQVTKSKPACLWVGSHLHPWYKWTAFNCATTQTYLNFYQHFFPNPYISIRPMVGIKLRKRANKMWPLPILEGLFYIFFKRWRKELHALSAYYTLRSACCLHRCTWAGFKLARVGITNITVFVAQVSVYSLSWVNFTIQTAMAVSEQTYLRDNTHNMYSYFRHNLDLSTNVPWQKRLETVPSFPNHSDTHWIL